MERIIVLHNESVRSSAVLILRGLPVDSSMEIVIREARKVRSESQNSRMWAALMRDISEQSWVSGRQYSPDCWHIFFKNTMLPEGDETDIAEIVKNPAEWKKWEYMPDGDRRCVGSTTKLTKKGMMIYQTKVEAYAVQELGVRFSAREYG